ncbi:MAG: trypsin-like peptidase domain-containing protein [Deltaproteobacteria bacterium]|nr:trypsin-like peptidase domain-containing protein [Deltaproteobacteria bacterium]
MRKMYSIFLLLFLCSCGATKLNVATLPNVTQSSASIPANYSVAMVLPKDRNRAMHRIVNQYGVTTFTLREGMMFESAAVSVLKSVFHNVHRLSDKTSQNLIVVLDGALEINTFFGSYSTTIRLALLTPDGTEIGKIEARANEGSGLVNDEVAIYNAYSKAINNAVQKILHRNPEYLPQIARLPQKKIAHGASYGTGFFVNNMGYILTNKHVVTDCEALSVDVGQQRFAASPVVTDPNNDLAVLRIDYKSPNYVRFDPSSAQIGQSITIYGYGKQNVESNSPERHPSLSTGNISYLGDTQHIHITAPIQPGNSGSPVITLRGTVAGIVSSTVNPIRYQEETGALPQNINRAIRSSIVVRFLQTNNIVLPELAGDTTGGIQSPSIDLTQTQIAQQFEPIVVPVTCH